MSTLLKSVNKPFTKAQIALHFMKMEYIVKTTDIYYKTKLKDVVARKELKPFSDVWRDIAMYYTELGDYINAAFALEKALRLNPQIRVGWENLGHFYRNSNEYNKAVFAYKKAIEIAPLDSLIYSHLALTYRKLGDYGEAFSLAKKALRINPNDIVGQNVITRILRKGNEENEEDELESSRETYKDLRD